MTDQPPAARLRPTRHGLGFWGLTLFAGGGCLMWTIILIPLAIPIALVGVVMMLAAPFVKTEPFICPKCRQPERVERTVQVTTCPSCATVAQRTAEGWVTL